MGRKIKIDEKDRLKKHMLLDKLMDGYYIEPITKGFYCKKCDCIVTIDWVKNEAYCVTDGVICSCIKDEDVKEPVTITQDGKVWLLLGEIKDFEEAVNWEVNEITDLREGKMQDAYSRHVEKRIKELHERMSKSKLHSTKKRKY